VQAQKIDSSGKFEKLVFHSSRCYGTCPEIHFQIDRNGIMILNRQFYQSKSESDTSKSGNFKRFLTKEQFKKLLTKANSITYEELQVPKTLCCDLPVITLIIYYSDKRYYFKSMNYPKVTESLISFLKQLGISVAIPEYTDELQFEN
jgi:hypothetical protein